MTPEMIKKIVEAREILLDLTTDHWDEMKPWEANKITTAELILAETMGAADNGEEVEQ